MWGKNKQFIGKLAVLIILFWLIDTGAGFVLDYLYASSKSGVSYQEYFIINKTNQELLIFGSSRASFHYVPTIFSKELNMSTYNASREATGIFFYYAVLLSTLERYTPKLIILDLDYRDIYEGGGWGFNPDALKELAPFYGKISVEFDSLLTRNWYDPIFFKLNLLKYNKKFFYLITGNIFKGRDNIDGYRPLYGEFSREPDKLENKAFKVDPDKVDPDKLFCLEKFIETAHKNDIQVILTVSPYYLIMPVNLFEPLEKFAKEHKIALLNYVSDQRLSSVRGLYYDEIHLNDKGARFYSSIVASEIGEILSGDQVVLSDIKAE